MQKLKTLIAGAAMVALPFTSMLAVPFAHAATSLDNAVTNLGSVNDKAGLGSSDLKDTIGQLIAVLLGLLGIIFLLLIIYAGFTWMTAQGDPKAVTKAKDIMITSVVGLIILLSAYAISSFVLTQLATATG